MRNKPPTRLTAALVAGLMFLPATAVAETGPRGLELTFLGRYSTGSFDAGAAEITAYDPSTRRVFVVNAQAGTVDVLDVNDPRRPHKVATLLTPGANSVAVRRGLVAVAQQAPVKTDPGTVAFFAAGTGRKLKEVVVGALPDMVTFTPDGNRVVVANEGEPSSYCAGQVADPEGSVSVVDVRRWTVRTAGFGGFDADELRADGVRITGPNATAAQDLEPEYITVDGDVAYVTLQENNALAIVDLDRVRVSDVVPLGLKDWTESGFDASDKDGKIDIRSRPVKGMYQPDSIGHLRAGGRTYLVTANEGDGRDWGCHADEVRVKSLNLAMPDAAVLKQDAELGRLNVAADSPRDATGAYTELHAFGGRSISVRSASGELVWDSGDELERLIARVAPADFNADNTANGSFDTRSDNKGPEPEGLTVGEVRGRTYAFAGLERIGGIVAYDMSDPRDPRFAGYVTTRDFTGSVPAGTAGDSGPEGVLFIPAADSPTRRPLLVVGNEVSGTTALYEIR
ncbi:choice-of-anchor I family protein [Rhizohabitans arisaemae]|uniref:choice-of-anchor I family protein n=1 Tax=Rhizohabitans arisaemae TaxID=2720610 RepID=UPI0024B0AE21|nr:choice-of-anchor I family protein [Rhizohabitans arisaemae]